MAGNGAIGIGVAAKAIKEQMIPARLGADSTVGLSAGTCNAKEMNINRILLVTPSEGGQCVAMVLGRVGT